ncbi:MAG TPA: nitronate monooxygenase family protein [Thermomicrobiales bacterium]|nr:nitronate monooxygenase family protein [Thermomicrobiales bacterium]
MAETFIDRIGIKTPIIQAPMAGVSTPALAAAVSAAGALGSISIGATDAATARTMISSIRSATSCPFNVNLFAHAPARSDPEREAAWLRALAPHFASFGSTPPTRLRSIYPSLTESSALLDIVVETAPPVVSFHFGLPEQSDVAALQRAGCVVLASVTSEAEGLAAQRVGVDAVVSQGIEAGGHRGVFDPSAPDEGLTTHVLTRLLVRTLAIPVVAAGGIMDGAGIAAALDLGAVAAQMGTAFIACPESSASQSHRASLAGATASGTVMTTAISGRPARCLANRFTVLGDSLADLPRPDYPIAYDAGKALHAAATQRGEDGYGAHWAGQGAALHRSLPASQLIAALTDELHATRT